MTIGKLKEIIRDLPDHARIYADDGTSFFEGNSEFVCLIYNLGTTPKCVLQRKQDIDTGEELEAMGVAMSEEGYSEQDYCIEAEELGFVPADFKNPEWAYNAYENYGLL